MKKEKNNKKTLIIVLVVFVVLTIILLVLNNNTSHEKALTNYEYIIEKETSYSDDESKGNLPVINLKGKDIEKINDEIMKNYYDIGYLDEYHYQYEYSVFEDILSLRIDITNIDGTEYGTTNIYTYNINVKDGKLLSDQEVLDHFEITGNIIDKKVEERFKDFYQQDELKDTTDYNDYFVSLGYDKTKNKLFIRDNTLYVRMTFKGLTKSLLTYKGNIYEVKIQEL